MRWKAGNLTGFGRTRAPAMMLARPERLAELGACLTDGAATVIAHGAGRSYGDTALNADGHAVLTRRLDRFHHFDPTTGELVVEAGVTFAEINANFLSRRFAAPVSPGTALATMGGAVANDVHGKNHDRVGSFGDHVNWVEIMLASGEVVRASPAERPDLFAATIGGIGLTGFITRLSVNLARQPSTDVIVQEKRMNDLDDFMGTLAAWRDRALYSVGWIDCLARGRNMGRGILQLADYAPDPGTVRRPVRTRRIPIDFPNLALNSLSIRAFNQLYLSRVPAQGRALRMALADFLYPLDQIHDWNRMYGKRGFYQFQCVIPDESAAAGIKVLMETIAQAGAASFLSVLKTLGRTGRGFLSFPMRGYTLALDFPRKSGVEDLIGRLNRQARDHGGRVYLAKDELLTPDDFAAMYPDLSRFRAVLADIDPRHRFQSDMARRLRLAGSVR